MHRLWVPGDECDLGYKNIRDLDSHYPNSVRPLLEAYWEDFEPYADKEFREEFSRQPDARFWEMYLCSRLLRAGKTLKRKNALSKFGPDFCVLEAGGKVTWIEAVTVGRGRDDNPDQVPEIRAGVGAESVPVTKIELRISTALDKKIKSFRRYLDQGIVAKEDRLIVAMSPSDFSLRYGSEGRGTPFTVLYPLGDQYVTFFAGSSHTESGYHRRTEVPKASGVVLPTGYFADVNQTLISGLIWSCVSLGNVAFAGNDLTWYPNTCADAPLCSEWLDWGAEWGTTIDENGNGKLTKIT